jgi:hypothetical protein
MPSLCLFRSRYLYTFGGIKESDELGKLYEFISEIERIDVN